MNIDFKFTFNFFIYILSNFSNLSALTCIVKELINKQTSIAVGAVGMFLVVFAVEVVVKVGKVGICGFVIGSLVVASVVVDLKFGNVMVHGVVDLVVKIVKDGNVMVHLGVVVGLVIN